MQHVQSETRDNAAASASTQVPRVFSYLRFSTPEQMKGDSHRRQTQGAEEYARKLGLRLDDELTFQDLGVSAFRGRNAENGALADFLELARRGLVPPQSILVVESLDRISRDKAWNAIRLLGDIIEHDIRVVTLADNQEYSRENLNANPMMLMYALMVSMRANDESHNKSMRLKAVWHAKREKADVKVLTSRAPAWVSANAARTGFELVPDRAAVVERIFQMACDGVGQNTIAETLNCEGVPVFGRGKHWHRSYINKMLANRAVLGEFVPHVMDYSQGKKLRVPLSKVLQNYFPAVVSVGVFDSVQAMRDSRGGAQRGRHARAPIQSIFAGGLARCPRCGSSMTRVNKGDRGGRPYLACQLAKAGAGCVYRTVHLDPLESALIRDADYLIASIPTGDETVDAEVERLDAATDITRERIGRLMHALETGAKGSPALTQRLLEQEEMLNTMMSEHDSLLRRQQCISQGLVLQRAENLRRALGTSPLDRAWVNAALRQLVKEVVINYDTGVLRCMWRHGGESTAVYAMPEDRAGMN